MKAKSNEFDPFLNECQTYIWEWYIPEHKVRFGIPSLNSLWLDDEDKNIRLDTMLERVHPDDIQKVLVRHNSPLYKSDKMFEVDLRLNVAAVLMPDGKSSGKYEWYGFRGKTVARDEKGRPTYVRGVAINIDQRIRAQQKLLANKDRQLLREGQKLEFCNDVLQEVRQLLLSLAQNADSFISTSEERLTKEERLLNFDQLRNQAGHLFEQTDRLLSMIGQKGLTTNQNVRNIQLWEHMAEQQQINALKMPAGRKLYFSNLYDDVSFQVNVALFDVMLESLINSQLHNSRSGYITLSYEVQPNDMLCISVSCTGSDVSADNISMVLTESGLGLSVCRLLVKQLKGELEVLRPEAGLVQYQVTIPLKVEAVTDESLVKLDVLDELDAVDELDGLSIEDSSAYAGALSSISVLIGVSSNVNLESHRLFQLTLASTTDEVWRLFCQNDPHIVFVDYNLTGSLQIDELIAKMHDAQPNTPIIVIAQYATRVLHHRVVGEGATYLLPAPLTLRKVNIMIKRYLK